MRRALTLAALVALLAAPTAAERGWLRFNEAVADVPGSGTPSRSYWVSDGASANDCTAGGGSVIVECVCNSDAVSYTGRSLRVYEYLSQASHGFSAGDVVRQTAAGAYAKAQADVASNVGVGLSLVVLAPDGNTAYLLPASTSREVTIQSHGLGGSFGSAIYLSRDTAGSMTTVAPDPGWRIYLGYIVDTNTIRWDPGSVRT